VADLPAVLTALGALVTAFGVIAIAYWSYRGKERAAAAVAAARAAEVAARESQAQIVAIGDKLYRVGDALDGQLTKFTKLVEADALARGNLAGRAELAGEQAAAEPHNHARNGDPPPGKP